jgi:hypothetical protein
VRRHREISVGEQGPAQCIGDGDHCPSAVLSARVVLGEIDHGRFGSLISAKIIPSVFALLTRHRSNEQRNVPASTLCPSAQFFVIAVGVFATGPAPISACRMNSQPASHLRLLHDGHNLFENRLRFIPQNPSSSDFAENLLSNWITFGVPITAKVGNLLDSCVQRFAQVTIVTFRVSPCTSVRVRVMTS